MYQQILLDSNVVIQIFNGQLNPAALPNALVFSISAVTVMELYALAGMSKEEEALIDKQLSVLDVIPLDSSIAKHAGVISRTRKRGKADLLIASTAITLNIPLLTQNKKDFRTIPEIQLLSIQQDYDTRHTDHRRF